MNEYGRNVISYYYYNISNNNNNNKHKISI